MVIQYLPFYLTTLSMKITICSLKITIFSLKITKSKMRKSAIFVKRLQHEALPKELQKYIYDESCRLTPEDYICPYIHVCISYPVTVSEIGKCRQFFVIFRQSIISQKR